MLPREGPLILPFSIINRYVFEDDCYNKIGLDDGLDGKRLLLGVTVDEFMLISICRCLCHIMIVYMPWVSWCQWFHIFMGFLVSMVS